MRLRNLVFGLVLLLTACGSPHPVLYRNAAYYEMGEAEAEAIVAYCMDEARDADIADSRGEGAVKRGTAGAAFGAVLWGAVGWIFGNPGRGAAAGAVAGGGSGAVQGAATAEEGDPTYQRYVEACLAEHGLDAVGWKR